MTFISWFAAHPAWYLSYALVIGLAVGSFLNVVAYRLPRMMEIDWRKQSLEFLGLPESGETPGFNGLISRSRCPRCGHAIRPWENVPVLSYLFLRGRCSSCSDRISLRYPVVEALTGLLSLAVALRFGPTPETLAALLFAWTLIALTLIDLDEQILPDSLALPLLWGGLALSLLNAAAPSYWFFGTGFHDSLQGLLRGPATALTGAIVGYLALWLPSRVLSLLLRKETMGDGDLKLLAAIGAWVGWQGVFQVVMIATFTSLLAFALAYVIPGKDHRARLPFGPFLALGGIATLFIGARFELAI